MDCGPLREERLSRPRRTEPGAAPAAYSTITGTTPHSARRADALGLLAEGYLASGGASLNGGERQQIVVHVDHDMLRQQAAGRCELEDGPCIPAETARRLACDAGIVIVREDSHGEPLDVGRRTRSIPPALRRAMNSRDRGCRFPGCTHTRYVDGHHVRHWADGGETKLSNLVTLCRFHHRQVHEGQITVERLDDGAWRFVKPDGSGFVSSAPGHTRPLNITLACEHSRRDGVNLVADHRARGLVIDATTAATRWRGERMDHAYAIDVLVQRAGRDGTFPRKRA